MGADVGDDLFIVAQGLSDDVALGVTTSLFRLNQPVPDHCGHQGVFFNEFLYRAGSKPKHWAVPNVANPQDCRGSPGQESYRTGASHTPQRQLPSLVCPQFGVQPQR